MAADSNDSDPGDEEINEYAELIGIDPSKEAQLMWIARQGITAPLPVDWKPVQTDDGELYFHNNKTNQSLWEHPSDQKFRQM
uniref:WW domain-containing protein n=1 Tax=Romanomermis culicivorax TaxID=13658 RepID=A0A915IBZ2_ROMCU